MDESDFIQQLGQLLPAVPVGDVGIGDDACCWTPGGTTCLSVDGMVEGRHFSSDADPCLVGRKAAAAALSDLAAMAARPVGAVVSLHCPSRWDQLAIMNGLLEEFGRHGCLCYGGDTTGADQLVISVTVWGEAVDGGRLLRRSGGEVGDLLVVTGFLGGSLASGRHLTPQPRFSEGQWLATVPSVHAMMDLSDGLAADAPKLAAASHCGCILLPDQVPRHRDTTTLHDPVHHALCDGEDFELLCAIDAAAWPTIQMAWPFDTAIHHIGWLIEQPGCFVEDPFGRLVPSPYQGFEHRAD